VLTDLQRIEHMLEIIRQIRQIIGSATEVEYAQALSMQFSLRYSVVMLGEDAGAISDDLQRRFPETPWKSLRGMRNIVVHDYVKTLEETLWSTYVNDVPVLESQLRKIQKYLSTSDSSFQS